jgi:hypothetical protein
MNEIPTAESILEYLIPDCKTAMSVKQYENAINAIKIHTEYYVKAALEAAADNAEAKQDHSDYGTGSIWVDKKSILNAYPSSLIQ